MTLQKAEAPTLAIAGVSHRYGARPALVDVSFSVAPSTFTVLLGLNGAGKSTLFSLITRLYGVQRGQIRIFGHDIAHAASEALRRVGVVRLRERDEGGANVRRLGVLHDARNRAVRENPALMQHHDVIAGRDLVDKMRGPQCRNAFSDHPAHVRKNERP